MLIIKKTIRAKGGFLVLLIEEEEQQGEKRAGYGKQLLKSLGAQLTLEFGKGFDERNLNNMQAFTVLSQFGTHCVLN